MSDAPMLCLVFPPWQDNLSFCFMDSLSAAINFPTGCLLHMRQLGLFIFFLKPTRPPFLHSHSFTGSEGLDSAMLSFTYPPVCPAFSIGSLPPVVRRPERRSPAHHLCWLTPRCVLAHHASPGGTRVVKIPRVQLWGSSCPLFNKSPSCLFSSR